jgi:hypothetical protein
MLIILVIFYSHFTLISFYQKFFYHKVPFFFILIPTLQCWSPMLMSKVLFPHISLIKHTYDHFDASSGLILFDQSLIICQHFNQILFILASDQFREVNLQFVFMKVKSHWILCVIMCIKILTLDITSSLLHLHWNFITSTFWVYFRVLSFNFSSPLVLWLRCESHLSGF